MSSNNRDQTGLISDTACVPEIVGKAMAYVLENFAQEIELDDLAQAAGLSRFTFCRRFQKECGISPIRWLWNFRTILAAEFINLDPKWSLRDIASTCGFTSNAHFSRAFKQMFQISPSHFRRDARSQMSARGGTIWEAMKIDQPCVVAAATRATMPTAV